VYKTTQKSTHTNFIYIDKFLTPIENYHTKITNTQPLFTIDNCYKQLKYIITYMTYIHY